MYPIDVLLGLNLVNDQAKVISGATQTHAICDLALLC